MALAGTPVLKIQNKEIDGCFVLQLHQPIRLAVVSEELEMRLDNLQVETLLDSLQAEVLLGSPQLLLLPLEQVHCSSLPVKGTSKPTADK